MPSLNCLQDYTSIFNEEVSNEDNQVLVIDDVLSFIDDCESDCESDCDSCEESDGDESTFDEILRVGDYTYNHSPRTFIGSYLDGKAHGYCYIFQDSKLLLKGVFKNGYFIEGECIQDDNTWAVGTFVKKTRLLDGKNCSIYEDYTKQKLLQKGSFSNGRLSRGEKFMKNRWYIGIFIPTLTRERNRVYEGYTKDRLTTDVIFVNGKAVEGSIFREGKWFVGTFLNNKLHGNNCQIYGDYEKTQLICSGSFQEGVYQDGNT